MSDAGSGLPRPVPSPGPGARRVVVLARDNEATAAVVHYLARWFEVSTVIEEPEGRAALARRRARRLGWPRVVGQLAFAGAVLPVLARRSRPRVQQILAEAGLDTTPVTAVRHVRSVNDPETVAALGELDPDVVVVVGTRIISRTVLGAVDRPFVNTHAGITPRYRGMNGAYWALAEGRPELVGTTVHLVDPGVDTGTVLGRTYFAPGPHDCIATYPTLHLVAGLPLLAAAVAQLVPGGPGAVRAGAPPVPVVANRSDDPGAALGPSDSRLWGSPTLWGYLARRWRRGLR